MTNKELNDQYDTLAERLQKIIAMLKSRKITAFDNWDFSEIENKLTEIEKRINGRVKK